MKYMKEIELDKDYVKRKILEVLKVAHVDDRKLKVIEHQDRLQYSCPICLDSMKSPGTSKGMRGNLYFKNLTHICFNEGCNMSFTRLLKTFNVSIDLEKKVDIYNYIDSNAKYSRKDDDFVLKRLDKLMNINEISEFFNTHPETEFKNFGPIKKNSKVFQYLKYERLISDFTNLYEADYHISKTWIESVIIILNKSGDKVLGMQVRNLKGEKKKRLFKTYNFEKLYNILHPDDPLDEIEALSYNKYSNFYNILNVNWEKPVTIFEGYLDSIFYPNSIGAIGINSMEDMSFLLDNDDDLQLQFFFDQDNIGVRKSIQKLDEGYRVFLWQKLVEKLISNKKDKYEAKKYALKIKDLNRLSQEMKNDDPYNKLKLWTYFSNDEFDKLYLDSTLYPDNRKQYWDNKNKN